MKLKVGKEDIELLKKDFKIDQNSNDMNQSSLN